jgi:thiosulfate sulfurtransferase
MAYERISIEQAKHLIVNENAVVIDIRDQVSYDAGHIGIAVHVHNDNVESFIADTDPQMPLLVCCYHGNMSKGAADYFSSRGFSRTFSIDGGYTEWSQRDQDQ